MKHISTIRTGRIPKSCSVNGKFYSSLSEAADAVGFTVPGLRHRLISNCYPKWKYIGCTKK